MGRKRVDRNERTRQRGYEDIARGLREFGYPDVTGAMVGSIHAAWSEGKKLLPHGVVGLIVGQELDKAKGAPHAR